MIKFWYGSLITEGAQLYTCTISRPMVWPLIPIFDFSSLVKEEQPHALYRHNL